MLAIIAAILFGVALILDLIDAAAGWIMPLMLAGLLLVALHLAGVLTTWRNRV